MLLSAEASAAALRMRSLRQALSFTAEFQAAQTQQQQLLQQVISVTTLMLAAITTTTQKAILADTTVTAMEKDIHVVITVKADTAATINDIKMNTNL